MNNPGYLTCGGRGVLRLLASFSSTASSVFIKEITSILHGADIKAQDLQPLQSV